VPEVAEIGYLDLDVAGGTTARAQLHWMEHALDDMHEVLEDIVGDIHRQTLAAFASEGAAIGDPWAALDPDTVQDKSRSGDAFPAWPLVATGEMLDSATSNTGPFSVGETLEHEAWLSLDWERDGWNIPLLHQLGVERREVTQHRHHKDGTEYQVTYWWHLPSRPFWKATDRLADEGADTIARWVMRPVM
jgi:hypothetical protein